MTGAPAKPVLSCCDLCVGYKGKAVLSDLNTEFERGQFVSLLGTQRGGEKPPCCAPCPGICPR
jgi:ABC-type Mn2+/Zn2+ transport system ATPase subunit